jgi:hypothetical protein
MHHLLSFIFDVEKFKEISLERFSLHLDPKYLEEELYPDLIWKKNKRNISYIV